MRFADNLTAYKIVDSPVSAEFYQKFLAMRTLFRSNNFGLGVLLGLSFILIYITNKYILSVGFYNNSGDILSGTPGQDSVVYAALQKWIYLSQAVYEVVKILIVSLILYTALYLNDQPVAFGRLLNVVIYCEYIFLIPAAIKIPWFLYYYPNGSITDWHHTYILSALTLTGDVPADWYYPLQTLNLFEVAYWFLLAYGISKITRLDFDHSLRTVIVGYIPALIIWVATVSFFTLIVFPTNG